MIPEQEVDVQLTPRLRQNFIKKGYSFGSAHSTAIVKVRVADLPRTSRIKITYQCDDCGSHGESVYFALLQKERHTCRSCSRLGKAPSNKFLFDESTMRELEARVGEGQSAPALAETFGTTPAVIRRVLKDAGVSLSRPSKLSADDEREVVALYEGGLSMTKIGRRFGVSKQPIRTVLETRGVARRSTSEAAQGRRAHNRQEFTADQVERIRVLYGEQGQGADEIAREFNLESNTPIHRIIREHGFVKKKSDAQVRRAERKAFRESTKTRLEAGGLTKARKLFGKGLNFDEIAAEMEMDSKTLSDALKKAGLENAGAKIPRPTRTHILAKYGKRSGHRAGELAKKLGLKKQVVLNFLRSRGVDTANAFGITDADVVRMLEWHEQGVTTTEMAHMLSKEKNGDIKHYSISKLLTANGAELGTYTHRYAHPDPSDPSREILLRGGWEKDVAGLLDQQRDRGEISSWGYEKNSIPYVDSEGRRRTYNPDFDILFADGTRELWEVKGRRFSKTSAKLKAARRDGYVVREVNEDFVSREVWPKTVRWDWSWLEEARHPPALKRWISRKRRPKLRVVGPAWTGELLSDALRELAARIDRKPDRRLADWIPGFPSSGAYQRHFHSWSAALQEAGFEPVKKRLVAKDGCECDSGPERVIDDFFSDHGMPHTCHPPYPRHDELNPNGGLIADWLLGDGRWIEYFGVVGNDRYEERKERKRRLARALGLKLVTLEREDLDPPRLRAKLLSKSDA